MRFNIPKMQLSIITTVYNAETDLPRLLDSMMAQQSRELEFFLIDNGSRDKSADICAEYAKKDCRFTVYRIKENVGYIQARNIGIQRCKGEYIGFCDSDDYLEPAAYDRAVAKLHLTNCDLYITTYRTHYAAASADAVLPYEKGLYEGKQISETILPTAFGPIRKKAMLHGFMWKQIIRRNIIIENGFSFNENLKPYEDQIFNIDVIGKCKSIYIDDNIIYNYISNTGSITAQLSQHHDYMAEWNRIATLYAEKKRRAVLPLYVCANANAAFFSIYSIILGLAKRHDLKISDCSNQQIE